MDDNIILLSPLTSSPALILVWVGGPVEVQWCQPAWWRPDQLESVSTRAFLSLAMPGDFTYWATLLKSSHLSLKCRNMRNNSVIAPSSDIKIKFIPSIFLQITVKGIV